MLRDHVQRGTIIGHCVGETVGKGLLIPDGLMEDVLASRLKQDDCDDGYVLDGFPRTVQQAEWYYACYNQPIVILLDVPEDEVLRRIAARNEHRPDDNGETVADRMDEYKRLTTPVIEYYEREASFWRVDGTIGVDNVFERIKNLMESKEAIAYG